MIRAPRAWARHSPVSGQPFLNAIVVTPTPVGLVVGGGGATLVASGLDQFAQPFPLTGLTVDWTSNAPGVATVTSGGVVAAVSPGSARITAAVGGVSGIADVSVSSGVLAVDEVVITPGASVLQVGGAVTSAQAVPRNQGAVLLGRLGVWETQSGAEAIINLTNTDGYSTQIAPVAPGNDSYRAKFEQTPGSGLLTAVPGLWMPIRVDPATGGSMIWEKNRPLWAQGKTIFEYAATGVMPQDNTAVHLAPIPAIGLTVGALQFVAGYANGNLTVRSDATLPKSPSGGIRTRWPHKVFAPLASGTATGAQTSTTLKDTTKAWTVNQWAPIPDPGGGMVSGSWYEVELPDGQLGRIVSNTADTLTIDNVNQFGIVTAVWGTTPVSGTTTYVLHSQPWSGNTIIGKGPVNINMWDVVSKKSFRRVYVCRHFRLVPNAQGKVWIGQNITKCGWNAVGSPKSSAGNRMFTGLHHGGGSAVNRASCDLAFLLQGRPVYSMKSSNIDPTDEDWNGVGIAYPQCVKVGQDHYLELELVINDLTMADTVDAAGGNLPIANGILNAFLQRSDGFSAQVFGRTDIVYRTPLGYTWPGPGYGGLGAAVGPEWFWGSSWNPTFGGGGTVQPGEDTFCDMDHWLIAGSTT